MEELYIYFIVASFGSAAIIILSYYIYLSISLRDIQKKMRDLDPDKHKPQKVENNLFIGSTKELTDLLDGGARKIPTKKKKDVDS